MLKLIGFLLLVIANALENVEHAAKEPAPKEFDCEREYVPQQRYFSFLYRVRGDALVEVRPLEAPLDGNPVFVFGSKELAEAYVAGRLRTGDDEWRVL